MSSISIVVPCYYEEASIPLFYEEICKIPISMENIDFEFIFVDDGSKDKTLEIIKKLSIEDKRVKYISFSRNFGKEAAMLAGLKASTGEYTAIMDVDLQDPPSLLPLMYKSIKNDNYDCVATYRVTRKGEPPIRSFFARLFYRLMNKISDLNIVDGARDFRLLNRKMVNAILSMNEYNRFSKGIFSWVGFTTKWIDYENQKRVAGETKWSFWKLMLYSIDGITAFSTKPLAIASLFGITFCIISILIICFIIIRTVIWGDPVSGWPSLVCIIFFIGGIQLFCVGILGQYLSKAYLESKKRPIYIIKECSYENN